MPIRKLWYIVGVILLAVLLSVPQVLLAVLMGVFAYTNRTWPLPGTVGVHPPLRFHSQFNHQPFWQDGFISIRWEQRSAGMYDCTVSSFDPESGVKRELELALSGRSRLRPFSIGPRIWFAEDAGNEAYELVDGVLNKTKFVMPRDPPDDGERFQLKGIPAIVERARSGFTVSTLQNGNWTLAGIVTFPDFNRERVLGGSPINLNLGKSSIQIIESKDRTDCFLHVDGLLLYRNGLEIRPSQSSGSTEISIADVDIRESHAVETVAYQEGTDSGDAASDAEDDLKGWTLVRTQPSKPDFGNRCTQGLLIDGQPAALIVDDISTGCPTGRLYRFDGTVWNEMNAQSLAFGSRSFRVVTIQDGLRSYVVAMTSTGAAHFYAVDGEGLRKTNARDTDENMGLMQFTVYSAVLIVALGLGLLLGAGTWFLMWWYTTPRYEFGVRRVKLASLGRRGTARLVDLGWIGLTTLGLGWLMTRDFDWQVLAEAVNLRIDHPLVSRASYVALNMAAWLFVSVCMILISQAVWGVTPGKWLCRLRTVQTSLRPCGFAASLAREFVFVVDCGNFVCWTPGIVSIAFTDRRQRLGDLVADTIVIESRSLT